MAEYLRRRRPPVNHPYWERLHDRAHPPVVVPPIAIPALIGVGIGLYGGLKPAFTMVDAIKLAATSCGTVAGITFVGAVPLILYDASRRLPRQQRWTVSVLMAAALAAMVFFIGMFGLLPMMGWYSACSGQGPWLGMLIGASIGAGVGAFYAVPARRRWRDRQRQWPRWERMQPLPPSTLSVTPISPPRTGAAEADLEPAAEDLDPAPLPTPEHVAPTRD